MASGAGVSVSKLSQSAGVGVTVVAAGDLSRAGKFHETHHSGHLAGSVVTHAYAFAGDARTRLGDPCHTGEYVVCTSVGALTLSCYRVSAGLNIAPLAKDTLNCIERRLNEFKLRFFSRSECFMNSFKFIYSALALISVILTKGR